MGHLLPLSLSTFALASIAAEDVIVLEPRLYLVRRHSCRTSISLTTFIDRLTALFGEATRFLTSSESSLESSSFWMPHRNRPLARS